MERIKLEMEDPVFPEGILKIAKVPVKLKPAGMASSAELWLSRDQVSREASSGKIPFISTGAKQTVELPINMPAIGEYPVLIDVEVQGVPVILGKGTENIVVTESIGQPFIFSNPFLAVRECKEPCRHIYGYWTIILMWTVSNPYTEPVTHTLDIWERSKFLRTGQKGGAIEYGPNKKHWWDPRHSPYSRSTVELTLPAGETYEFVYDGCWSCLPSLSQDHEFTWWLQDELGNKSSELTLKRALGDTSPEAIGIPEGLPFDFTPGTAIVVPDSPDSLDTVLSWTMTNPHRIPVKHGFMLLLWRYIYADDKWYGPSSSAVAGHPSTRWLTLNPGESYEYTYQTVPGDWCRARPHEKTRWCLVDMLGNRSPAVEVERP